MKLQRERVGEIAGKLRAMPPSSANGQITKQGAISELAEEIRQLQQRGYTTNEIARVLSDEGLPIAPATLKNYLQRSRLDATRRPVARRKVATAGASANAGMAHNRAERAMPRQLAPVISAQQVGSAKATFAPSEDSKDI